MNNFDRLKKIFSFFKIISFEKKTLYQNFILIFLVSALELLSLYLIKYFLIFIADPESLNINESINIIFIKYNLNFLALVISIFLITFLFKFILIRIQARFIFNLATKIKIQIFESFFSLPFEISNSKNKDKIIATLLIRVRELTFNVIHPLIESFSFIFILIFMIAFLISQEISTTLIIISIYIVFFYFIFYFSKNKLADLSNKVVLTQDNLVKLTNDAIYGHKDIYITNAKSSLISNIEFYENKLSYESSNIIILGKLPKLIIETFIFIIFFFIGFFILINNKSEIQIIIPSVGIFMYGILKIMPYLNQVYGNISKFYSYLGSIDDVIMFLESFINVHNKKSKTFISKNFKFNSIEFKDVSFSYSLSKKKYLLYDLNFLIKKGDSIGIHGSSGSGKSTLLDLIIGLRTPTKGNIYLNNKIVNHKNDIEWLSKISYVSQNFFIFSDTIINNITLKKSATKKDIILVNEIIKVVKLDNFIENLDAGLNYKLSHFGSNISGGQKQRLAIARSLFKEFEILILDEATNALDKATEIEIYKNIMKFLKSKTLIIVSHNAKNYQYCNKVISIKNGKIIKVN